ncbi:hypothetical protein HY004_03280 [Candidatus Saccharibacteria bacterium]|nr:hypothetical protein [Candidatus Saccharibacteria bacterium]
MSERQNPDVLKLEPDSEGLARLIQQKAERLGVGFADVLKNHIGLSVEAADILYDGGELSEADRALINVWLAQTVHSTINPLSVDDELATHRIGRPVTKGQFSRDDSSDMFTRDDLVDDDYKD